MNLTKLQLTSFKNYSQLNITFKSPVVCFAGENGEGKTNLLDAVYYACIGKSYFNAIEAQNILHSQNFFRIEANFTDALIEMTYQNSEKKKILKNKVEYERLSDHLGFAPVSFIAPDDNLIILGGSENRRKFLNATISQCNPAYVKDLLAYRKLLSQRNASLKTNHSPKELLQSYNKQIAPIGKMIFALRSKYVALLSEKVEKIYAEISSEKEVVSCQYSSQLNNQNFEHLLRSAEEKDRLLQRTTVGIHKDDLEFTINSYALKKYGSQGQQKTFLLALKLAEFEIIQQITGQQPILLLDDIFDKLDRNRVHQLFQYLFVNGFADSQIFMTDTNIERLHTVLSKFANDFTIFKVQNNELSEYAFE